MIRAMLMAAGSGFTAPNVDEFFPKAALFAGTAFRMTRINLIGLLMTLVVMVFFTIAFRKPQFVPRGIQNAGEVAINFVRINIVEEVLGKHGRAYEGYLSALFFMVLAFNVTGFVPGLQIAGTSVVAIPMLLAIVSWIVFNASGIRHHGLGHYLKANLFPSGVPAPIYLLVTPIEFISTFLLRPVTLDRHGLHLRHGVLADFSIAPQSILLAERCRTTPRRAPHRLRLQGMGTANVRLLLAPGTRVETLLGPREISEVFVGVDEPDRFVQAIGSFSP